jgi:hypothetical protein
MTRVADGLGVDLEAGMAEVEERDREALDTSTWGKRAELARKRASTATKQ